MATDQEPFPSQVADKYVVRFPDGMRDRLKAEAAANNRSLNAEIVARLQRSFEVPASFLEMPAKVISGPSDGPITKEGLIDIVGKLERFAHDLGVLTRDARGADVLAALNSLPVPRDDDPSPDSSPSPERTAANRSPDTKPPTPSSRTGKTKG